MSETRIVTLLVLNIPLQLRDEKFSEIIEGVIRQVKGIQTPIRWAMVLWYICTMQRGKPNTSKKPKKELERVQTGVRLEKRLLKVLKALAEYMDVSLGELIEIIVLSSFEGTPRFSKGTLARIAELKRIYDVDYGIEVANMMVFTTKR